MARESITPDETDALDRIDRGLVVEPDVKHELIRRGLVEQRLGGLRLSTKGLNAAWGRA